MTRKSTNSKGVEPIRRVMLVGEVAEEGLRRRDGRATRQKKRSIMWHKSSKQPVATRTLLLGLLTSLLIANLLILQSPWLKEPARYLIIHADDAGMYACVNRGTIEAMEHGVVSSASIMVPCPGFNAFAEYAAAHPEKDFGVHLTLTCDGTTMRWGPVLGREAVPSLVDEHGFFWPTAEETAKRATLADAAKELRAQINTARKAGIAISHLDHHMFVLFERPDFVRLYVQLGMEYGLPIRYPSPDSDYFASDLSRELAVALGDVRQIQKERFPALAGVESRNYRLRPAEKRDYLRTRIENLMPGVTEFVIHCARAELSGPQPPDVGSRVGDLQIFTSEEMRQLLRERSVQVTSWRDFNRISGR